MSSGNEASWLLLITALATAEATPRMRIWRALKALGAASLRDGAYLLPDRPALQRRLTAIADDALRAGGTAQVLLVLADPAQEQAFKVLFDRSADYAEWTNAARALQAAAPVQEPGVLRRTHMTLQRQFEALVARDYFPGSAQQQASAVWQALETAITARLTPGEPQAHVGEVSALNRMDYQRRYWATRQHLGIDRTASAWLIQRFIDPQAQFIWLAQPGVERGEALGFDFDGAEFTHIGDRVTFEVLLASFGLDRDPALRRIGNLVHYLDVGGIPVSEAAGLATLLDGLRMQYPEDDHALLAQARPLFDMLYVAFGESGNGSGDIRDG